MHIKRLVFSTHRNATQKHFIQNLACSQNLEFLLEIVERVRVKKHEKKSQFLIFSLPEHVQLDVD